MNEDYVKKVKEAGLLLHPYTVNGQEEVKALETIGATGVFTDFIDNTVEVMKQEVTKQ